MFDMMFATESKAPKSKPILSGRKNSENFIMDAKAREVNFHNKITKIKNPIFPLFLNSRANFDPKLAKQK